MRNPLVIGNWKSNGSVDMVNKLITNLRKALHGINGCDVAIAPPTIYLDRAKKALLGSCIALGAQNVDKYFSGAFTGEISLSMLKDVGAKYIMIGHSERRSYHKENDKEIAEKFRLIKKLGLIPVLCIGETEEENVSGRTEEVCSRQIDATLNTLGVEAMNGAIIAYEPVWAIGTGKSATPSQAQNVHRFIRSHIAKKDNSIASNVIIQYGGSVTDKNAAELFSKPDIDGVLVGSASLIVDVFSGIVKAAAAAKKKYDI